MIEISRFERSSRSAEEPQNDTISRSRGVKCLWDPIKVSVLFVVCLMGAVLFSVLKHQSSGNGLWIAPVNFKPSKKDVGYNFTKSVELPKDKILGGLLPQGLEEKSLPEEGYNFTQPVELPKDKILNGLLPQGWEEKSLPRARNNFTQPVEPPPKDKLVGGLLPQGLENKSFSETGYNFTQPVEPPPKDKLVGGLLPQGLENKSLPETGYNFTQPVEPPPKDKLVGGLLPQGLENKSLPETGYNFTQPVEPPLKDKLLGGLLPKGLEEKLCLSRYQSVFYHKQQTNFPSSHLISKLRNYEALHKQCGPYTKPYNRTTKYLKSGQYNKATDCNYVVWIGLNGLGNKMISLASVFLYALLTNRVLLVHPRGYIPDLFCEPFPNFSWLLPSDFPIIQEFRRFTNKYPNSYGNMLKGNVFGNSTGYYSLPQFLYLHLAHDYDDYDQRFFCDREQTFLQKIPWLIIQSNQYFIPALFSVQSFEEELSNLFPDKSTVFHFLGRYLFHPTNTVWGLITKYYNVYLARADEKIGIQIRYVVKNPEAFKQYLDQILACATKENLLPQINENETIIIPSGKPKTKAVLITSLSSRYSEEIRNMYDQEHPTITGEVIKVFQPSHEEYQQTKDKMHNMKAWEEIYLLSLTDKLVISSTSTFGYVAQSLGGLKPWILPKPQEYWRPYSPCKLAISMEPCFHFPPSHNCKIKGPIDDDLGKLVSHVRNCEDWKRGIKLVDEEES